MKNRSDKNGSGKDDWETPQYIIDYVVEQFRGGYLDPCPINPNFDGLKIPWRDYNYVNPPYSKKLKEAFIRKAFEESKKGNESILLIPASTETKVFHDIIIPNAEVLFIRGRVPFKGFNTKGEWVEDKTGQSGSMLVRFGPKIKPRLGVIELTEI